MPRSPAKFFLHRVKLRNFKSVAGCDVALSQLTLCVGANGSGKSNFLDALNFVADALLTSLDHALRVRGGIKDVRRRSAGRPNHFTVRLEFTLDQNLQGHYAFTIGAKKGGGFEVLDEECRISEGALDKEFFRVKKGEITTSSLAITPAYTNDRLYLVKLSGEPGFRPLYDALSRMSFYRLAPDSIRHIQPADDGLLLAKDGANLASVFARLDPPRQQRVIAYLAAIVPGIEKVSTKHLAGNETLEFKQLVEEDHPPQTFLANCMSDGTLRALGILVALLQERRVGTETSQLVAIEEPEIALHPAAAGILFDVLREGSETRQVLVTSHSPDLLDNPNISADDLLAVEMKNGTTVIAPIDNAGRQALRESLYTPGELLRLNQLSPDYENAAPPVTYQQMKLFDL
ncbi:MAG: AAA family ATPase [Verrucomicrobiae bacterium]|nr:AAA family ATPase [Verrucomicrobiae bacterium]